MLVISTREFRDKQSSYLNIVKGGDPIILRSPGFGSFKLSLLSEDDTLITKEELFAKIERGIREFEEGKVTSVKTVEELHSFLESL